MELHMVEAKYAKINDWNQIISLYKEAQAANPKLTAETFCKEQNINRFSFSREFAKLARVAKAFLATEQTIKKSVEQTISEQTRNKLQALALPAAEVAGNLLEEEDPNIRSKAAFGILDRAGFAPQTEKTQINLATQVNVALFPSEHKEDLEDMLK
jgi:excinuclease UvrABC ATPase subunit